MSNEPIRHHYIPQFILKNFSFNNSDFVHYYDKNEKKVYIKNTRDIFMMKNLYRDEGLDEENPTKIEKDLSKLENEASMLIRKKILQDDEIYLSNSEQELLKLFFAVMSFRSKNTYQKFNNDMILPNQTFYKKWQDDKNFNMLWKRNLSYIINCRTLTEILKHPNIDEPFKLFFRRDMFNLSGLYFAVLESKDNYDFILSDCYPLVTTGYTGINYDGIKLQMYTTCPLSPKRALMIISRGVLGAPRNVAFFRPCILQEPKQYPDGRTKIRVKKLYKEEMSFINSSLMEKSSDGIIFKKNPILCYNTMLTL